MTTLTDLEIQAYKGNGKDQWVTDGSSARGVGRLVLRITPTGTKVFYFKVTTATGKREVIRLGDYDPKGMGVKAARKKFTELSLRYQNGETDLKAILTHEQREKDVERKRVAKAREDAAARAHAGTLARLMALYVEHLKAQGKTSWQDVAYLFDAHIIKAFPALAESQARTVSAQDLREVLARLVQAEKGRTAGKLRSYLKAAFSLAMRAEFDPTAPEGFKEMHVEVNPVDRLPALSQFNVARERALTWPEARAYLHHLEALPATGVRDLLMLSFLLGGQRPEQLGRITEQDVDLDGRTVTILDPKGKRQQARQHTLPLSDRCIEIINRRIVYAKGGWLFSSTNGRLQLRPQTSTAAALKISEAMQADGTARAPFQMRDIRRTCETLLASMGVSRDLRAQLQSHGLSGVQQRHYDKHEYMDEKRRALSDWERRLFEVESADNVVQLRSAA
jgi:integrase